MNPDQPSPARDVYTITRLNREVRAVLEGSFPPLWVQGEISNLARPASGHLYFSLKDRHSQVRCAMFKNRNQILRFQPENGIEVIARATISLYEGRGEFQLIIEQLEPAGVGALQLAFEQLKERLQNEGLFDSAHKQPIPGFPDYIGVITSPTGAAIRDILHVLKRRYPCAGVIIYPTAVQGEGSATTIAAAIEKANLRKECDVLILARGGGSLEDLWSFNEETVARAIYQSGIPLITGIGHEIDFTIADFVADQRAPTPSSAAELASPDQLKLKEHLGKQLNFLNDYILRRFNACRDTLARCKKRLINPAARLRDISQHLDEISLRMHRYTVASIRLKQSHLSRVLAELHRLNPRQRLGRYRDKCRFLYEQLSSGMSYILKDCRNRLESRMHNLQTVSPLATLDRGYAIVTDPVSGVVLRDAGSIETGKQVSTRVANGVFQSTVTGVSKNVK